jgi:hypothetical protein
MNVQAGERHPLQSPRFTPQQNHRRKYGIARAVFMAMLPSMKTTIDIPDELFRLAKARAAMSGISLRQFVTDTLRLKLEQDQGREHPADPPWMKGFAALAELRSETARIQRLVEAEFEQIETEP